MRLCRTTNFYNYAMVFSLRLWMPAYNYAVISTFGVSLSPQLASFFLAIFFSCENQHIDLPPQSARVQSIYHLTTTTSAGIRREARPLPLVHTL